MNETRRALAEGILRQVNEGIEQGLWPGDGDDIVRMRCECGRSECTQFIEIRVVEYEQVRSNPRLFLVRVGHETDDIETVVDRHSGYVVVLKTGRAAQIAEATDPRDESTEEIADV